MAIVYRHIRLDTNEVFYIGIGKNEKRAYQVHNRRNIYWRNIVKKTDYKVEITHKDICYEEACSIEQYLISFYGRSNLNQGSLCNLTDGGEGCLGLIVSEKTKEKFRGSNNHMFGKTHSEEVKKRMIKIITERMQDEKVRKKISDKAKGRKISDSHREKLLLNSPKRIELYRYINNKLFVYKSLREAERNLKIHKSIIKRDLSKLGFISKEEFNKIKEAGF